MSGIRPAVPGTLDEPRKAPKDGPRTSTWVHLPADTHTDRTGKTFNQHVARAAAGVKKGGAINAVADVDAEILRAMREP